LLNEESARTYGRKREPGEVCDLNFYAQSYITPRFDAWNEKTNTKPNRIIAGDWRRYDFKNTAVKENYLYNQMIHAQAIRLTRMPKNLQKEYNTNNKNPQTTAEKLEAEIKKWG